MPALEFGVQMIARGAGDPATSPNPGHRLMLEDGQRIEQLGLDSLWLPDHFYFERPSGIDPYPEVWTLLSALAATTERIKLGTNVLAATFRHPALMAKMAGAVQDLSDGRFILGLGAGNQTHEHAAFGFDFAHRIGRFKEYLPIMTGLLKGETVTFDGRYFTLNEASLRTFVPPVPVWVASGGPQMYELTARYASGWNMAGGGMTMAGNKAKYDEFAASCSAIGRSVRDYDICKMTFMAVAPDGPSVDRMVDELATRGKVTPDALTRRTLVATPDGIAEFLRGLVDLGINQQILAVQPSEQWPSYLDAVELLTREVIPRVRL
jgi:alkanesulfonate monooxygenase SsuD/methylene tetrahydromethanopterin reductase-like flavin-dependent oxidoreductase (luciferase family)